MIGRKHFTNCETFGRFHERKLKKIKGKAKLSLASASLLGALALMTKIILLIFTTANDSPHLSYQLLMTFSGLEKPKDQNFLEEHDSGARAKIEQKPLGAS